MTVRRVFALLLAVLLAAVLPAWPASADDRHGGLDGRHSLRAPVTDENFYFVMADRFANGDTANDTGGLGADPLVSGFDPTRTGFYNGGDLKGLLSQIDYIRGLGTTSIWLTPSFKNKAVQLEDGPSAGYHGYWITDFTQIDPHLGTNADLRALVEAAHGRGMKVYFDIITNHTADVIGYESGARQGLRQQGHGALQDGVRRGVRRPRLRRHGQLPGTRPGDLVPRTCRRSTRPRKTSRCRRGSTTSRSTTTAATRRSSARTPTTATSSASTTCSPRTPASSAA